VGITVVFCGAADDATHTEIMDSLFKGHIVTFGTARREKYFTCAGAYTLGHCFSGRLNGSPDLSAFCVDTGRISELLLQYRNHCFNDLAGDRSSGGIIKIDTLHCVAG
jgi:hypothetical protein